MCIFERFAGKWGPDFPSGSGEISHRYHFAVAEIWSGGRFSYVWGIVPIPLQSASHKSGAVPKLPGLRLPSCWGIWPLFRVLSEEIECAYLLPMRAARRSCRALQSGGNASALSAVCSVRGDCDLWRFSREAGESAAETGSWIRGPREDGGPQNQVMRSGWARGFRLQMRQPSSLDFSVC